MWLENAQLGMVLVSRTVYLVWGLESRRGWSKLIVKGVSRWPFRVVPVSSEERENPTSDSS